MNRPSAPVLLAGAIGSLLVAAGGSLSTPLTTGRPATAATVAGGAAYLAGVGFLVTAWVALLRARPGTRAVVVAVVAWSLPLLVAPPLASRDVHSYAAQAELVARGLDPYAETPFALGDPEFVTRVDPLWRSTTAPYGPGWLAVSGGVAKLAGHDQPAVVTGFRVLALAGLALLGAATASLAADRGRALALTLANPLSLLHLVAGGHNEALMVGLGAAGFALARRRRLAAGVVLIGLAAAVKAPALALLPFAGWHAAPANRLRNATLASLGGLATLAAVSAATGLGWGWVASLDTPGTVRTALAPVTGLGVTLGGAADALGLAGRETVLGVVRAAALAGMALLMAYLLFRGWRLGALRATGAAMLAMAFLNPAVHVWYALWGLPFLAAEDDDPAPLVRLSAVLAFVLLPNGTSPLSWAGPLRFVVGAVVVGLAVAPLCRTIARRATTGTSSADSSRQRAGDGGSPVTRPA